MHRFQEIEEIVERNSFDDLILLQERRTDRNRYVHYWYRYLKKTLVDNGVIKAIKMIKSGSIKQHYIWTQCRDEGYNKNYRVLLRDLKDHISSFGKVYELLEDDVSREIYYQNCRWRLTRFSDGFVESYNMSNQQYLEDFEHLTENEVFVDCGGYIGDSTEQLIEYTGGVKKVFLYEPSRDDMTLAMSNLECLGDKVVFREAGVGERNIKMFFDGNAVSSTGEVLRESKNGCVAIDVVSLDDDIKETVSFVKMDVEGSELEALKGMRIHIKNDRPVLAVCVYHKPEDIYTIPLLIHGLVDGYRYYLRQYTPYHGETVLYAVPKERG